MSKKTGEALLVLRPMLDRDGHQRTLVMGVMLGELCPEGVDRRVRCTVTIEVHSSERARRKKKGRSYTTEAISHGSLMLEEVQNDPKLWEPEPLAEGEKETVS